MLINQINHYVVNIYCKFEDLYVDLIKYVLRL